MGEARAAVLFVTLAACGFDSGGVGGSGALQDSSSADGSSSPSTSADVDSDPTSGASTLTTHDPGTSSADTSTSSAIDESSTSTSPTSGTSTGDEGPPELGPFAAPIELVEINTGESDDDPTLSPDMLEIYFASLREGGQGSEDIWRATRLVPDGTFDEPEVVTALNSSGQDGWPELSHDGLVLTLGSDRAGGGFFDIYVTTRASLDVAFPAPTLAADLSTTSNEAAAALSSTMLEAFLCSPLAATSDLHVATRTDPTAMFPAAVPLATVNSISRDCTPFIDASGTRLLFASDRFGTTGAMDIWSAERTGEGAAFEDPVNVGTLNTTADDDDPWWAPDGSALYFSSSRGDGSDLDLWVAYRE